MAYILTYSANIITVEDGTLVNAGGLSFPGKNYAGYGSPVDQNMVSLAENFASFTTGPANAFPGQLWYDKSTLTLKYNTSANANIAQWTSIPSAGGDAQFDDMTVNGNLITTRITTGSFSTPGTITGNWTLTAGSRLQATYADLAERHHSDNDYPLGTVMTVGGIKEVTAANSGDKVLGVISGEYAYLMNADAGPNETHPPVAYVGRLPVRVVGPISKNDRITIADAGRAKKSDGEETFGWALETNMDEGEHLILCIIK